MSCVIYWYNTENILKQILFSLFSPKLNIPIKQVYIFCVSHSTQPKPLAFNEIIRTKKERERESATQSFKWWHFYFKQSSIDIWRMQIVDSFNGSPQCDSCGWDQDKSSDCSKKMMAWAFPAQSIIWHVQVNHFMAICSSSQSKIISVTPRGCHLLLWMAGSAHVQNQV